MRNAMDKFVTVKIKCSGCGTELKKLVRTKELRKNGNYSKIAYCKKCSILETRKYRGRTMKDMDKENKERLSGKTLSKEEIAKIAHTLTPPSEKKKDMRGTYTD